MQKTTIEWEIVKLVIKVRKGKKKSQRDIAALFGFTAGYIGQIEMETHASMYSYDQLNVIAKFLGCSLKDFMPTKPI